jgi:putative nucleotidyltransferase with HDIG domain
MGMSAKVLQLANTGLFGPGGRIGSAAEVVTFLGLDTVRTLLLTLHAFSAFQPSCASHFSVQALASHSMATGVLAERIIRSMPTGAPVQGHMRMIGLLHDTGRLVLAANLPESLEQAHRLAVEKKIVHWEAEREVFGATHAEVGAYLFGLWGLPETVVEAIAYHHEPGKCPHPGSAILTALHVADVLAPLKNEQEAAWHANAPDLEYLASVGAAGRLTEWRELCRQVPVEEVTYG